MTEQDETPAGFGEEEEEWIIEQRQREADREKRASGRDGEEAEGDVNINSLMDIMVILLVFLLKSYGDQPIKVTGSDLKVPESSTKLGPEDMTAITVTRNAILVNDKKVTDVPVDKSQKKGGETGLEIVRLMERLNTVIEKKKQEMKLMGKKFDPVVTIIADQSTQYRLLTEVMYTAGQAGLSRFKFAVVRKKRKHVSPLQ
jgi:biopolymer transport protein ExbD